ncbi:hypothetical protein [Bradyrhizobium ottawaense]|uniref:hypothetical protein n=1 Tax=Bradyrhizobium ottawaense TaxID=931866 RepID=UPI0027D54B21|nr:hypothetical protein BwSH14_43920 [Bradyrhizobium ottawaense]GMO87725.1 hypothetical protein BwSH17_72500 [Bradyrhizobium ottawaense]
MTFVISGDLQWFSRSKYDGGKTERKLFDQHGYCAIYFAGKDRALRLGWTGRDPRRIGEPARIIAWCANDQFAKRVVNEVSQLLNSRLVSGRYDVPVQLAEQAICVAANNVGVQITSHEAMMQHVRAMRHQRLQKELSRAEAELRNAELERKLQSASPASREDEYANF